MVLDLPHILLLSNPPYAVLILLTKTINEDIIVPRLMKMEIYDLLVNVFM